MRRQPTEQEFEAIMGIVKRVEADRPGVTIRWNQEHRDLIAMKGYYEKFTGQRVTLRDDCPSCHLKALDFLRELVNLPALTKPVPEALSSARMNKCLACPVYRKKSQSCGRLIKDALAPKPVMVEGEPITPCGCFLPLKVLSKYATCPANRWVR